MDEKICRNKLTLPKDILRQIQEFLVNNQPWMNKLMDSTAVWVGWNNDSENIEKKCRIKRNDFSIIYIGPNIVFAKGKVHFENGVDRVFSQKHFQAIFKEASELMAGCRYISGAGVLRGDTVVEKTIGLSVVQDTIHVPDYKESIPAWRKQLKSELKRIEKAVDEKLEKKCKKIEEKNFPIDYLTRDILRVALVNEYGLSKTTFCAIMRSVSVGYGVQYSKPSGIGNYNLISKEEVENRLIRLLSVRLLETRRVSTTYYFYENIVPTAEGEYFLHSMEKKKTWKSNETEKKYKRYIKRKSEAKYFFKILDLIFEDKAFFCFHQQDILTDLRDCTQECKTLLKMKKKVEKDRYKKKIYIELLR